MSLSIYLGALVAFVGTLLVGVFLLPLSRRIGLVDVPCARKNHCTPTPLVGGIAMLVAFAAGGVVAGFDGGFWAVMAGGTLLLVLGVIDDLRGVDYRLRFAVQGLAAALLVVGADVRVDSLGNLLGFGSIDLGFFATPFSVFAVVGMINAVNMLDGLDGLAGGVSLVILIAIGTLAAVTGSALVAPIMILAAVVLAFLVLNYRFPWRRRAHLFMGDAGSYFLGYCIAWYVIALPPDAPANVAPVHALWIAGFPVADTLTTMWRRRRQGLSMFHAGHDHAHHLLRRAGFGINATVLILLLLTASFALVGVNGVLNQRLPEPVYSYLFVAVVVVYALLLNRILPLTRPIRQYLSGQMVVVSTDATDAAEGRRP